MGITDAVRYSSGEAERGKTTSTEVGYLFQARRGDSWPKDQAEHKRNQRGFIFKGRFVEETRETLVVWGSFEYSLVEMAFVVGQGVISPLDRGW